MNMNFKYFFNVAFKIAVKNVKSHWRKSMAATLAISLGLVAQTLFIGYLDNVESLFVTISQDKEMFGHVIIENKNRFDSKGKNEPLKHSMTEKQISEIQNWLNLYAKDIDSDVQNLLFSGIITNGNVQALVAGRGHSMASSEKMRNHFDWNVKYGIPLEKSQNSMAALLGMQMGKTLSCLPDVELQFVMNLDGYEKKYRPFQCVEPVLQITSLTEKEQINAMSVNVTGLIDGGLKDIDSRLLVTDLVSVQQLLNTKKISYWTVKFKDEKRISELLVRLNTDLQEISPDLHAVLWQQHLFGQLYVKSVGLLNIFRWIIMVIILVIAGTSVFNTSLKSVLERVKEIGALLSLGYRKKFILQIFIIESFLLAVVGNVVGIVCSLVMSSMINALKIAYKVGIYSEANLFQINSSSTIFLNASIITITVSLLTTWFAVRHYINRKIIDNLNG